MLKPGQETLTGNAEPVSKHGRQEVTFSSLFGAKRMFTFSTTAGVLLADWFVITNTTATRGGWPWLGQCQKRPESNLGSGLNSLGFQRGTKAW